jgi:hypothetical protein
MFPLASPNANDQMKDSIWRQGGAATITGLASRLTLVFAIKTQPGELGGSRSSLGRLREIKKVSRLRGFEASRLQASRLRALVASTKNRRGGAPGCPIHR